MTKLSEEGMLKAFDSSKARPHGPKEKLLKEMKSIAPVTPQMIRK